MLAQAVTTWPWREEGGGGFYVLHLYGTPSRYSQLVTEVLFQIGLLQIICISGFVAR